MAADQMTIPSHNARQNEATSVAVTEMIVRHTEQRGYQYRCLAETMNVGGSGKRPGGGRPISSRGIPLLLALAKPLSVPFPKWTRLQWP